MLKTGKLKEQTDSYQREYSSSRSRASSITLSNEDTSLFTRERSSSLPSKDTFLGDISARKLKYDLTDMGVLSTGMGFFTPEKFLKAAIVSSLQRPNTPVEGADEFNESNREMNIF